MSSPGPESFYRAPASGLETDRPRGPGPSGRFDFATAWRYAWLSARHQYLPAMAIVIVGWTMISTSYLTCLVLPFTLPHLLAGLRLAGLAMSRGENGFSNLFRPFGKYPRVFLAGMFLMLGGGFLQSLPFLVHFILRTDESEFMSEEYVDSLAALYSWPVFAASILGAAALRLYFQARFLPLFPLLVERDLNFTAAVRASYKFTRGDQASLFALHVLTELLNYFGMLLLCLGYFLTAPFVLLVKGAALRQLLGELPEDRPETPEWLPATNTDSGPARVDPQNPSPQTRPATPPPIHRDVDPYS